MQAGASRRRAWPWCLHQAPGQRPSKGAAQHRPAKPQKEGRLASARGESPHISGACWKCGRGKRGTRPLLNEQRFPSKAAQMPAVSDRRLFAYPPATAGLARATNAPSKAFTQVAPPRAITTFDSSALSLLPWTFSQSALGFKHYSSGLPLPCLLRLAGRGSRRFPRYPIRLAFSMSAPVARFSGAVRLTLRLSGGQDSKTPPLLPATFITCWLGRGSHGCMHHALQDTSSVPFPV